MRKTVDRLIAESPFATMARQVRAKREAQRDTPQAPIRDRSPQCIYCRQEIVPEDDSQHIGNRLFAHSRCAWDAEDAYWAAYDKGAS